MYLYDNRLISENKGIESSALYTFIFLEASTSSKTA